MHRIDHFEDFYRATAPHGAFLIEAPPSCHAQDWLCAQLGPDDRCILSADYKTVQTPQCFHRLEIKNSIGVDDIRWLEEGLHTESFSHKSVKDYVILGAHALSIAAQNALLKPLEDTRIALRFWLYTDKPHILLETLRSRLSTHSLKSGPGEQASKAAFEQECEALHRSVEQLCLHQGDLQAWEAALTDKQRALFPQILARYYPRLAWEEALWTYEVPQRQARLQLLAMLAKISQLQRKPL